MEASLYQPRTLPDRVLKRIFNSGRITEADRQWLLWATLSEAPLSHKQLDQVRTLFDRLQMGLLKVEG